MNRADKIKILNGIQDGTKSIKETFTRNDILIAIERSWGWSHSVNGRKVDKQEFDLIAAQQTNKEVVTFL